MKIHPDNFSYSILLSINEGKSRGSGFRLKYKDYNILISAKHVFFDDSNNLRGDTLVVTCPSSPLGDGHLILQFDLSSSKIFYSANADICIVIIGVNKSIKSHDVLLKDDKDEHKRPSVLIPETYITVVSQTAKHFTSVDFEATRCLKEIGIANDVYLMGYPTSLGLTKTKYFDISKPLIRKGIVSGINFNEKTFVIDCPSYQGNSGGPVIEQGEDGYFRVIGLVSHYIPYETTWYNSRERIANTEVSNSGFSVCVPFDEIINLIETNITKF